jgi:hypothetical protein
MALQKEIWINSIIEGLFADNTFAARSVNHSAFIDGKTVHIPGAGAPPSVTKTRASALQNLTNLSGRTDTDLTYNIEIYFAGPVLIENPESVELSYDKRESVLRSLKAALSDNVYKDLIYKWIPAAGATIIPTSGKEVASHVPSGTGDRLAVCKADIRTLRSQFDKWDIPQKGRCLMLDAEMYGQLLSDLTDTEANAFLATANAATGIIGQLYSFDIYMRSTVARAAAAGAIKALSATTATDSAAGFAWSDSFVSRALGDTEVNENEKDAIAFGDILSATVRAGGSYTRNDKKGVVLFYQGTPA